MADIEIGQTFIDFHSTNLFHPNKPKYHIAMSFANDLDDEFVCFIMNTERRIDKYKLKCNKSVQK